MAKQADKPAENIRETIESVIVAFILAFVFRAFVVEAFVIPTGSMAPTLYGEHWMHTCSRCGFEYAVGATRDEKGRVRPAPLDISPTCPNCDWRSDRLRDMGSTDAGDRILVLKWPWSLASIFPSLGPQRWDVTVFKDPKDGQTNFIKRLIGLPGEVIMIIDGDIYTASTADLPDELLQRFETLRGLNYEIGVHGGDASRRMASIEGERLGTEMARYLKIQRKPESAQEALWSVVYDHDHPSRRSTSDQKGGLQTEPGWRSRSDAWKIEPGVLRFDNRSADPAYAAFDGKPIEDRYAYNAGGPYNDNSDVVRDIRLRCVLVPKGGNGYFRVALSKRDDVFFMTLSADGTIVLSRDGEQSSIVLARSKVAALTPGEPVRLEVRNVDYRVSAWVNGDEVLHTDPEAYKPPIDALLADEDRAARRSPGATVMVAASQLAGELRHVVIDRDVHYRSPQINGSRNRAWDSQPGWATARNPVRLRDGEYFVLGDNSPASEDGRLWSYYGDHLKLRGEDYQIGTVPADQMIGKAFFVYWPAGYRPAFVQWGIIPNVGRMRWIH